MKGLSLHQRGRFVFRETPLVLMGATDAGPQALGRGCLLKLSAKNPATVAGTRRPRKFSFIYTAPLWV